MVESLNMQPTANPKGTSCPTASDDRLLDMNDVEFITGMPLDEAVRQYPELKLSKFTVGAHPQSSTIKKGVNRIAHVKPGSFQAQRAVGKYSGNRRQDFSSVEAIINAAISREASDVHIEPHEGQVLVRYRIDGSLLTIGHLATSDGPSMVARLKVMARLDITEKRRPQDGRIRYKSRDTDVDLRISVLPTLHGEKVAIRILPRTSTFSSIKSLGMSEQQQRQLRSALTRSSGMVIVTGPTGSGKTTTMYAALRELMGTNKNICTLEDPIEYCLDGANQSQIREEIGYTFANSLRSLLRQDPDIVLVGEMRDTETARIAIRAAMTGHLVLSTLHTNNAVSTIARLRDMGIETYLIASALTLVIAQRLVRKLCDACGGDDHLIDECTLCSNTGYRGRIAIFEMLTLNDQYRRQITDGDIVALEKSFKKSGMETLQQTSAELIGAKLTTAEEAGWIGV